MGLYRFTAESLLYDCISRLFESLQRLFAVLRFRQDIVGVVGGDGEDGDAVLGQKRDDFGEDSPQ